MAFAARGGPEDAPELHCIQYIQLQRDTRAGEDGQKGWEIGKSCSWLVAPTAVLLVSVRRVLPSAMAHGMLDAGINQCDARLGLHGNMALARWQAALGGHVGGHKGT